MTRDEAAQIILAAFGNPDAGDVHDYASRLATALDALGLLNLADTYGVAPNPEAQLAVATSNTSEHAAILGGSTNEYWASTRKRT